MSPLVVGVEWELALTRKRTLARNMAVVLAFVVPVATGALTAERAPVAYVLIFALFSMYGSATALLGDARSGLVTRIIRSGVAPWSYLLQRSAAGAAVDTVQLLPSVVFLLAAAGASTEGVLLAFAGLASAVWIGNLLGALVAAGSRSAGEALPMVAAAGAVLIHMSGAFRTPSPGSLGDVLEGAAPFRALHEGLLGVTTGAGGGGWTAALVWCLVLPAAITLLGGPLLRSLGDRRVEPGATP